MNTRTPSWLMTLALALTTGIAAAQTTYQAALTGGGEVPANGSTASGTATFVLNDTQDKITGNLTWSGLSDVATGGHIHGPAAVGVNGPVIFNLGPSASTAGSVSSLVFTITPTQVGHLQSGLLYVNVHSTIFPGGEIRGQLLPVATAQLGLAANISWYARTGFHYQVEGADAVNTNVWFTLGAPIAGNNATNSYFDPLGTPARRFYRVVTQP